jgi:hypothetical protein
LAVEGTAHADPITEEVKMLQDLGTVALQAKDPALGVQGATPVRPLFVTLAGGVGRSAKMPPR